MTRRESMSLAFLAFILVALSAIGVTGCDRAYHYVFFPPERAEYTLAPDPSLLHLSNDTSYSLSRDSSAIVFDQKTYKIEVKYVSDYQLNTFEFPDDSKDGEFSANPFTFANWVDPQTGFTPSRFSVFKVSIFNYTASKLNFDPEQAYVVTDRGDLLPGFGREEKSSHNQSIEGYYRKRKGSSGVDDEVFERRMGIVRQTVLYLGRPIYAGDSREGFIVFDAMADAVEKVKLSMKNFITAYDENNEPSGFVDLQFYFKRVPLERERFKGMIARTDTTKRETGPAVGSDVASTFRNTSFDIGQIRYGIEGEGASAAQQDWNLKPNALSSLIQFMKDSLKVRPNLKVGSADSPELANVKVAFLFVGALKPVFSDVDITAMTSIIRRGGFLFIDNSAFSPNNQYFDQAVALLQNVGAKIGKQVRLNPVPNDNQIYRIWKRMDGPPEGKDDTENMPDKRNFLQGLFVDNILVAAISSKGYSMIWDQPDPAHAQQFILGTNIVMYAVTTLRPETQ